MFGRFFDCDRALYLKRGRSMLKMLVSAVLLLLGICPAQAQWQRIEMDAKGGIATSDRDSPHPMTFYLTPSAERDASGSLCLRCKANNGQQVSLQDYAVETSEHIVGQSFGRTIFEIRLSFHVKGGSVAQQLRREWSEKAGFAETMSSDDLPMAEWKSIVMQSSADMYRELYLIINEGQYDEPLSKAHLLTVGSDQLLATNDRVSGNGGSCTEGYWVLKPDGPWLLDFSAVHKAIEKMTPSNATAVQTGCWALSMQKLEVRSPVQLVGVRCRTCDFLGTAVVRFKIDGHRAVPVSSLFEHEPTN